MDFSSVGCSGGDCCVSGLYLWRDVMKNKDKQYLSQLELRVDRLEFIFQAAMNEGQSINRPSCNQCGAYDPVNSNFVCSEIDCCQGLNPCEE